MTLRYAVADGLSAALPLEIVTGSGLVTRSILKNSEVIESHYSGIRFYGLTAPGAKVFDDITLRSLSLSNAEVEVASGTNTFTRSTGRPISRAQFPQLTMPRSKGFTTGG